MIRDLGVEWVILGHSERRNIFGETDEVKWIGEGQSGRGGGREEGREGGRERGREGGREKEGGIGWVE